MIRGIEKGKYSEAQRKKYADGFRKKDHRAKRLTKDLLVFCGKQDDERKSDFFAKIVVAYFEECITFEEMEEFFRIADRVFVEDLTSLALADDNRKKEEVNIQVRQMKQPDVRRLTDFDEFHKLDDAASSRLQALGLVTVIYLSVLNGGVKTAFLASALGQKFLSIVVDVAENEKDAFYNEK